MKRFLIVLALSGCVTTEELGNQCTADYGFKPGTEAHGACMLELQGRADERRMRAAAALSATGASMQANAARMRPQQCTYNRIGATVYQNCY